ncbi:aspartic peptidase domain-containing protein [Geranomyces variabilis]|nr:aspartic peptidase domain-containing protein [Geranomyces variabilis]KAJ3131324.1 hypothetical protein HDU90_008596 [Geranomyces variabilis]
MRLNPEHLTSVYPSRFFCRHPIYHYAILKRHIAGVVARHRLCSQHKCGQDAEQNVRLTVGTPPQEFWSTIDTGTAYTWFPAITCKSPACANYTLFDAPTSSTFKLNASEPFYTLYGSAQSVNGTGATDVLHLAGHTFPNFDFGYITSSENLNAPDITGGLIGMGLRAPASEAIVPLKTDTFDTLQRNGVTKFALTPGRSTAEGRLALGAVDTAATAEHSDLSYAQLTVKDTQDGTWLGRTSFLGFGSNASHSPFPQPVKVFLDTGSGLSMLPAPLVAKLAATLSLEPFNAGANGATSGNGTVYPIACEKIPSLPSITFDFNNVTLSVRAEAYVFDSTVLGFGCVLGFIGISGPGSCSTETSYDASCFTGILAGNILRDFYTTWDFENRVVGFASLTALNASNTSSVSSSSQPGATSSPVSSSSQPGAATSSESPRLLRPSLWATGVFVVGVLLA